MADAERAGDVDNIRLRRSVAAEDLLRRYQDALGRERLGRRFWAAAAISSVGVALVAVGAGSDVSGGYWGGIRLGLAPLGPVSMASARA